MVAYNTHGQVLYQSLPLYKKFENNKIFHCGLWIIYIFSFFLLWFILYAWKFLFYFLFILILLCFMWIRWENSIAGCNTVSIWRFNVHICVPLDSCFESEWRGNSTWFHICNFHVGFNVGKLNCISTDGPLINKSWKLHANCVYNLICLSPASHCNKCMARILIP